METPRTRGWRKAQMQRNKPRDAYTALLTFRGEKNWKSTIIPMNVLLICSRNQWRSTMALQVLRRYPSLIRENPSVACSAGLRFPLKFVADFTINDCEEQRADAGMK